MGNLPSKYQGNDWNYNGCYTDSVSSRTLPNLIQRPAASPQWNQKTCLDAATAAGFPVAGLEYGGECWAGNALPDSSLEQFFLTCTQVCNDASDEACGGANALDIYVAASGIPTPTAAPTTTPAAPTKAVSSEFTYDGCYTDAVGARTLPNLVQRLEGNTDWTASSCLDAVSAAGYEYGGIIYGGEWGANDIAETGTQQAADQCLWTCNDDKSEQCGGQSGLDVYKKNAVAPPADEEDDDETLPIDANPGTTEPASDGENDDEEEAIPTREPTPSPTPEVTDTEDNDGEVEEPLPTIVEPTPVPSAEVSPVPTVNNSPVVTPEPSPIPTRVPTPEQSDDEGETDAEREERERLEAIAESERAERQTLADYEAAMAAQRQAEADAAAAAAQDDQANQGDVEATTTAERRAVDEDDEDDAISALRNAVRAMHADQQKQRMHKTRRSRRA